MNLKQLEALIYVARHGTFRQAAETLYFDSTGEEFITPESIQYRIKQLEKELGVSLYRKRQGSSRVVLTREGQVFLAEALDVYQRLHELRGMFEATRGGWLSFASTQAVIIHRLLAPMRTFRDANPGVRLRALNANAAEIERLVAEGQVDFGFTTRPPEHAELDYVVWKRSHMVLITPKGHPLAKRNPPRLEEIGQHPLVLLEPEIRGDRELVDDAFRRLGLGRPNVVLETSNSEIIAAAVEAGIGVSIIAETTLVDMHRRIDSLSMGDVLGHTEVGLLVREGQHIPSRMRSFLDHLDPLFANWLRDRDARLAREKAAAPAEPDDYVEPPPPVRTLRGRNR